MLQLKALRGLYAFFTCVLLFYVVSNLFVPVRAAGSADLLDDLDDADDADFDAEDDLTAAHTNAGSAGAPAAGAYSAKSNDDGVGAAASGASAGASAGGAAAGSSRGAAESEDEEDAYYDADEFEGLTSAPSAAANAGGKKKAAESKPASPKITPVTVAPAASGAGAAGSGSGSGSASSSSAERPSSYVMEIGGGAFIVLYVINFFVGRRRNEQIAQKWFVEFRELFDSQFAALGSYEGQPNSAGALLKESQSVFKFYASGRRNCQGMLCTMELRKRHDLFSTALALVDLSVTRDTLTLELQMDDEVMEPFVFALVRRKELQRTKKANRDLEQFAAKVESAALPQSLAILTDAAELEKEFVDDRVCSVLRQCEPYFSSLHFTDQNPVLSTFDTRKVLRFRFNLPGSEQFPPPTKGAAPAAAAVGDSLESVKTLTKMAIHFVDRIAAVQLSDAARAKSAAKRKKAAELANRETARQRQEAIARRKDELKRREDEQAAANMTPEQLKRKEEKDYKKSLKAKQPRVKMIR